MVMTILERIVPDQTARRRRRKIYLLAAGFLLCALLPAMVDWSRQQASPRSVVEARPYPYFPVNPRSDEIQATERQKAFESYLRNDFQTTLDHLRQLDEDPEIIFYRAVCEYFLGQDTAALKHFTVSMCLDDRWRAPALWYQANIHHQHGDGKRAEQLLKTLIKERGEFRSDAEALLERISVSQLKEQDS
jgi:hypothetical protein